MIAFTKEKVPEIDAAVDWVNVSNIPRPTSPSCMQDRLIGLK